MYILLLGAPIVALLVFLGVRAAERGAERRAARPAPVTDEERIAAEIPVRGLRRVLIGEHDRFLALTAPVRNLIAQLTEALARATSRYMTYGKPVLEQHPHLVAYVVLISFLSVLGVFFFIAGRSLEVGLLLTLEITESQAELLGSLVAVAVLLLGGALMELVFPGKAFPAITGMSRAARSAWIVGAAIAFSSVLIVLPTLATARADMRFGPAIAQQQAVCRELRADPGASEAERSIACAKYEQTVSQRDRARQWDSLVAVAAPLGEAVGMWGALRLAELAVAGALARAVRRRARRLEAAQGDLRQQQDEWVAVVVRGMVLADVDPDEIEAWRAGEDIGAPPGADEPAPGLGNEAVPDGAAPSADDASDDRSPPTGNGHPPARTVELRDFSRDDETAPAAHLDDPAPPMPDDTDRRFRGI